MNTYLASWKLNKKFFKILGWTITAWASTYLIYFSIFKIVIAPNINNLYAILPTNIGAETPMAEILSSTPQKELLLYGYKFLFQITSTIIIMISAHGIIRGIFLSKAWNTIKKTKIKIQQITLLTWLETITLIIILATIRILNPAAWLILLSISIPTILLIDNLMICTNFKLIKKKSQIKKYILPTIKIISTLLASTILIIPLSKISPLIGVISLFTIPLIVITWSKIYFYKTYEKLSEKTK